MKFFTFENTDYLVDTDAMALRYGYSFEEAIMVEDMDITPNGYSVPSYDGNFDIPFFVQLDPKGMRNRFSLPPDTKLPQTDQELSCNPALIEERIKKGRHPAITAGKWKYYVNVYRWCIEMEMSEKTNWDWRPFTFDEMIQYDFGFRFHIDNRTGMIIDDTETANRKHCYIVEIPHAAALDPVGWARLCKEPLDTYLDKHPIRFNIEARFGNIDKNNLYSRPQTKRSPPSNRNRKHKR